MTDIADNNIFHKIFQYKAVRFFLSAGVATLVDVVIYFITINYIFSHQRVKFLNLSASAHTFTLVISYSCGVIINFLLTKYAVFSESNVATKKQFFRFSLIAFLGFFANYGLLRFFVEILELYPTFSRIASALSLGIASYYVHKLFTFKVKE
ncbi:GtrA family protein [Pedobacter alpinus]|uniref:GtrA family protein n=1 Tax=Pedobacter alpinus TaxID=1590643 RepID=A0ABW5TLJ9_9SPHI